MVCILISRPEPGCTGSTGGAVPKVCAAVVCSTDGAAKGTEVSKVQMEQFQTTVQRPPAEGSR